MKTTVHFNDDATKALEVYMKKNGEKNLSKTVSDLLILAIKMIDKGTITEEVKEELVRDRTLYVSYMIYNLLRQINPSLNYKQAHEETLKKLDELAKDITNISDKRKNAFNVTLNSDKAAKTEFKN